MKRNLQAVLAVLSLPLISAAADFPVRQLKIEKSEVIRAGDGRDYTLELLGKPLTVPVSRVCWVSSGPTGGCFAWAAVRSPETNGILGWGIDGGKRIWLDLSAYFTEHGLSTTGGVHGDSLYFLAGNRRTAIFKYHIPSGELKVIKNVDRNKCRYWLGVAVGPEGNFYWGAFPSSGVIGVDVRRDRYLEFPPLSDDPQQQYVVRPQVDDDGILYAPTGLNRPELYALDLKTGEKNQILNGALLAELLRQHAQVPEVRLHGGQVYLECGDKLYRCRFSGIETTPSEPEERGNRRQPPLQFGNGEIPVLFSESGLELRDPAAGSTRTVPVEYPELGHELFTIGSIRNNVLYGSGIFGARVFGLDLTTMRSTDFGVISGGTIQNYELFDTPKGLILSSYTLGALDLFDPGRPVRKGVNPLPLARLHAEHKQERIWGFPGGVVNQAVYSGAMPVKGTLGGALVKVDLNDHYRVSVWRNIVRDQTIRDVYPDPSRPGSLLFGTTVNGGSGSRATETEAVVAAWDTEAEKVVWTAAPFGPCSQIDLLPTSDAKFLVIDRGNVLLLDPATRNFTGLTTLPERRKKFTPPGGPEAANYFIIGETLYKYTPAGGFQELFKHVSFQAGVSPKIHGDDLYYGENSRLWRLRLR